ncbi:MAG: hypothetical protein ABIH99_03035 [Candidatus Micrarchaeota archaeon]
MLTFAHKHTILFALLLTFLLAFSSSALTQTENLNFEVVGESSLVSVNASYLPERMLPNYDYESVISVQWAVPSEALKGLRGNEVRVYVEMEPKASAPVSFSKDSLKFNRSQFLLTCTLKNYDCLAEPSYAIPLLVRLNEPSEFNYSIFVNATLVPEDEEFSSAELEAQDYAERVRVHADSLPLDSETAKKVNSHLSSASSLLGEGDISLAVLHAKAAEAILLQFEAELELRELRGSISEDELLNLSRALESSKKALEEGEVEVALQEALGTQNKLTTSNARLENRTSLASEENKDNAVEAGSEGSKTSSLPTLNSFEGLFDSQSTAELNSLLPWLAAGALALFGGAFIAYSFLTKKQKRKGKNWETPE